MPIFSCTFILGANFVVCKLQPHSLDLIFEAFLSLLATSTVRLISNMRCTTNRDEENLCIMFEHCIANIYFRYQTS